MSDVSYKELFQEAQAAYREIVKDGLASHSTSAGQFQRVRMRELREDMEYFKQMMEEEERGQTSLVDMS